MSLVIRAVARSDVGLVRKTNEDSGYAGPRVLAVADGMGGHAAGEVASAVAIETLADLDGTTGGVSAGEAGLREAISRSHQRIAAMIEENEARTGMGTTVTALLWNGRGFDLIHIGDSRAYRIRDNVLEQITHDQTYVQMLLDSGRLTPEEVATHPARSLLLQALGGGDEPRPDVAALDARPGDRWLLCSDGLSGVVNDDTIATILRSDADRAAIAETLVDRAIGAGAPDNVTVVVADVVETDEDAPASDDTTEAHLVGAAARGAAVRGDDEPRTAEAQPDDEESDRYRVRERGGRRRWLRYGLAIVMALGVLAVVGFVANSWVQSQFFVTSVDDQVVISQGIPSLPGEDIVYTAPGFPASALPDVTQQDLGSGITADNEADARRLVDDLRREACITHRPKNPLTLDDPKPGLGAADAGSGSPDTADTTDADSTPDTADATDASDGQGSTSSFPGLDCTGVLL